MDCHGELGGELFLATATAQSLQKRRLGILDHLELACDMVSCHAVIGRDGTHAPPPLPLGWVCSSYRCRVSLRKVVDVPARDARGNSTKRHLSTTHNNYNICSAGQVLLKWAPPAHEDNFLDKCWAAGAGIHPKTTHQNNMFAALRWSTFKHQLMETLRILFGKILLIAVLFGEGGGLKADVAPPPTAATICKAGSSIAHGLAVDCTWVFWYWMS